jgi:hypothetical protein
VADPPFDEPPVEPPLVPPPVPPGESPIPPGSVLTQPVIPTDIPKISVGSNFVRMQCSMETERSETSLVRRLLESSSKRV